MGIHAGDAKAVMKRIDGEVGAHFAEADDAEIIDCRRHVVNLIGYRGDSPR
jgi:hypothetical protein